ncbi:MAG: hypothetical protein KF858_15985 [Candidatus Sumerlaeia bacterium]|nr:hypothetical protein [Candidatus Sumerlaeia bacterium]
MPPVRAILAGTHAWSGALAGLVLVLFVYVVATVPIRADNDCWWHVKSGKVIAEQGLPHTDVFSFTAEGYPWHNHEWLTQWAMWQVWMRGEATALGGWRAVILAASTTIAAYALILFVLAGRISRNWWIALLVASIAVAVGRRTFHPRPPLVGNVLLAAQLLLLTGVHERWWSRRWLAALPPMFALWSNLHGTWMAGLVVLGAYAGGDVAGQIRLPDRVRRLFQPAPETVPWRWWAVLVPACVVATWANPFGWRLYELPARVLGDRALVASIGELQPPNWFFVRVFLGTLAATVIVIGVLLWKLRLPRRLAEWGIYVFFLYQGVRHVRHLLLYGVMAVPLLARLYAEAARLGAEALERRPGADPARVASTIGVVVLACVAAVQVATVRNWPEAQSYIERNRQFVTIREGYLPWAYPAAPSAFLEAIVPRGRMFNENHYGGYLIWRFSPETHKVFADPRFDIFGGTIWRHEVIIANALEPPADSGFPTWRELLDHWEIEWMLLKGDRPLAARLRAEPDEPWVLVADWSAQPPGIPWQIWIRNSPGNRATIERARARFALMSGGAPP